MSDQNPSAPADQQQAAAPAKPPVFEGSVSHDFIPTVYKEVNERIKEALKAAGLELQAAEALSNGPGLAQFAFAVPTELAEHGVRDAFSNPGDGESSTTVKTGTIEAEVNFYSAGRTAFHLVIIQDAVEFEELKKTTIDACVKILSHRKAQAGAGYAPLKAEFLPEVNFAVDGGRFVAHLVFADAGIVSEAPAQAAASEAGCCQGEGECACETKTEEGQAAHGAGAARTVS